MAFTRRCRQRTPKTGQWTGQQPTAKAPCSSLVQIHDSQVPRLLAQFLVAQVPRLLAQVLVAQVPRLLSQVHVAQVPRLLAQVLVAQVPRFLAYLASWGDESAAELAWCLPPRVPPKGLQ